jgi:class 3 adenylate cyclase
MLQDARRRAMSETRKIAAILVSDIVGYSRLAGADEDRILARLRALRSDLIDPTIALHHGRVVKRTGDGSLIEFRSVVDAVRCAIEMQNGMVERNAGLPPERRIEFRVGIHLGDVVEESDGDLMGDGVRIALKRQLSLTISGKTNSPGKIGPTFGCKSRTGAAVCSHESAGRPRSKCGTL